ncbi:MAG TPA: protein translocase subunit SecD [Alphaproteobacteria bacterium]|jgi:preprotein translocase subunit SecD
MVYIPRWQIVLILAICVIGAILAAPNLLDRATAEQLPDWLPKQQINLGLDLRGGSHLLLEVEAETVIRERLDGLADSARNELRQAQIRFSEMRVDGSSVRFRVRDPADLEKAREAVRKLAGSVAPTGGMFSTGGSDIAVEAFGDEIRITMTEAAVTHLISNAVSQTIEVIRRRIDETGIREPSIQQQGERRVVVQVPGLENPEELKDLLGETAKMTFHLVDTTTIPTPGMRPPPGTMILPDIDNPNQLYVVQRRVMVSGENLIDAQATFEQGRPVVSFRFDSVGARRFADVTRNNVGRPFAIVLDDKVISAPIIREPILGGSGIISGNFTVESANKLALLLRAGALPAPVKIVEERTVGAGLGADSIEAGKIASVAGMLLVVAFMVVFYGRFGVMADIALLINLILIAGVLSLLQATLTLPGIAGILLTIGMAVDANVLIFERIREEVRAGRTPISAIDSGYNRAMTTIIDSNLTTAIAGVLLYMFGSGTVKGFAVTLTIGLATSMFTAIMVTRLMVVWWLRKRRPQALVV